MPVNFELVKVEHDPLMLELRSTAILDDRHLFVAAYVVEHINIPAIMSGIFRIVFRRLEKADIPFGSENFQEIFDRCGALELHSEQGVCGAIICLEVIGVYVPAFKYDRVAFDMAEILDQPGNQTVFRFKVDEFGEKDISVN